MEDSKQRSSMNFPKKMLLKMRSWQLLSGYLSLPLRSRAMARSEDLEKG